MTLSEKSISFSGSCAPPALGEPHHQPDRDHDDGTEQEIAPQPDEGVEAHVPDRADQPFDAAPDIARVEPDRRQDHADQDRQQDDPYRDRERRSAEEAVYDIIGHQAVSERA